MTADPQLIEAIPQPGPGSETHMLETIQSARFKRSAMVRRWMKWITLCLLTKVAKCWIVPTCNQRVSGAILGRPDLSIRGEYEMPNPYAVKVKVTVRQTWRYYLALAVVHINWMLCIDQDMDQIVRMLMANLRWRIGRGRWRRFSIEGADPGQ